MVNEVQKQPSTPPAKLDPIQILVMQHADKLQKLLPQGMNIDRFTAVVIKAIKANPKIFDCEKVSLLIAIAEAAELGLEPGGSLGSGYLVPYKGKIKFIPGYRGYIQLAYRCGKILMEAKLVYEDDYFECVEGTSPKLVHKPNYDVEQSEDKIKYAYAVAFYPDGRTDFLVMTKKQIDACRDMSQSKDSEYSPWVKHYSEMARKTPIRRLAKYLPLNNDQWAKLMDIDNGDTILEKPLPQLTSAKVIETNKSSPFEEPLTSSIDEPEEPGANG